MTNKNYNVQPAITTLTEIYNLLADSPEFDVREVTTEQRRYSEPFAMDTMKPEQWLYHVYIPVAINHLTHQEFLIFNNVEDFHYYFLDSYKHRSNPDTSKLINLLLQFEKDIKQLNL